MAVREKTVAGTKGEKVVVSVCGICPGGCGVEVYLADGKIDKIKPLKDHPMGIICTRGAASKDVVYSEDRLLYPMKRVGQKGEGKFERISWGEALDRVANGIKDVQKKYGPASIADYSGRGGGFEASIRDIFGTKGVPSTSSKSFVYNLGSPNSGGVGSICYIAYGQIAPLTTFGCFMRQLFPDYANSELIVVWGANPATDSPPIDLRKILAAKRKGAKLIVIDHMMSHTAEKADDWIAIRPGTDGALALAMLNIVIKEKLYDAEFVGKWTLGFEELKDYVAQFTPEKVAQITWVPACKIIETARAIALAKGVSLCWYTGLEYTNSGMQNMRAVHTLLAITGNLDAPGGIVLHMPDAFKANRLLIDPPESGPKPVGADKYPLFYKYTKNAQFMEFPRAVLQGDPYPVKGLIISGSSLITSYPDPELWKKTLGALDFLVVMDRFMTQDALYADIVLPACTGYETTSYQRFHNFIQLRQKLIDPIGESKNDYLMYAELAERLGLEGIYPRTEKEAIEFVLKGTGVTYDDLLKNPSGIKLKGPAMVYKKYEHGLLRKDKKPGFDTPSGKFEITSTVLKEHGYDALPKYVEPIEGPIGSPELYKEYPLIFNSGARTMSAFRTQHLNIEKLLKMQPRPHVLMHPDDAKARGIADGEKVMVVTPRGQVAFWVKLTEGILRGVVEVNAGGGGILQKEGWKGANVNHLTDPDNRDPVTGFPVYKALLCDVGKIR